MKLLTKSKTPSVRLGVGLLTASKGCRKPKERTSHQGRSNDDHIAADYVPVFCL
jgi:hypothetical protein